jgi:Lon protease-like protein
MDPLARCAEAASCLKIFPLPSAVLFPASHLPLHIFEERYRALVKGALLGNGVLALGQLEPGWEPHYAGRPPLKPLCTLGILAWHELLADGRYNILLQGVVRGRIVEELSARHSYREVRVEILPDSPVACPEEEALRQAVLELTTRLPAGAREELAQVVAHARGGGLADAVASAVVTGLERRWSLLCEPDVPSRLRAVLADVGELIARMPALRSEGLLN